jgi:HlyD family secretion protein
MPDRRPDLSSFCWAFGSRTEPRVSQFRARPARSVVRALRSALSVGAALMLGCTTGCDSKAAATQRIYQGVIEHDERALAFELAGRVRNVAVQRGDTVTRGSVLAALDAQLAELTCRARRDEETMVRADLSLLEAGARPEETASLFADVRAARAQEQLAQKTKARAQMLRQSSSVGQVEVDRADSELARTAFQREALQQRLRAVQSGARPQELARARARVEAAGAAVALEQERLARHTLRASEAGRVIDVSLKPGEFANPGMPVIAIADLAHPYADVFVPQGELAGIRVGDKAELRVDGEPTLFRAQVEHIATNTEFTPRYLFSEEERRYLVVRVRVRVDDRKGRLNAGVPAFVNFERR